MTPTANAPRRDDSKTAMPEGGHAHRRPRRTVLATLALLLAAAPLTAQPVYHATFVGAGSHVAALNDAGVVVYRGSVGVTPRAYVGLPGQSPQLLLMPPGLISSDGTDINEAGVITGLASPYSGTGIKAFPALWTPDGTGGYAVAQMLPLLPGDDRGTADALNDVGDVLGTSAYLGTNHTVRFTPLGAVDLGGMSGLPATAVNDQRVYVSGDTLVHLDDLSVETLPVPPGASAVTGRAINASGQVGGELLVPGCGTQVALHTPGLGWQTFGVCGSGNACFDVNAGGDVLMTLGGEPWVSLAGQGLFRVEDLIADDLGHWTVDSPAGIALNDARQLAVVASNATTGQGGVILLTPGETCQADLGFGGPGALQMSMCGGDLSSGTTADVHVTGGPASGTAFLLLGLVATPVAFKGGQLVPVPWVLLAPLPLDGAGAAALLDVPGGNGPLSVYAQAVAPDASLPLGFAISNALRIDLLAGG